MGGPGKNFVGACARRSGFLFCEERLTPRDARLASQTLGLPASDQTLGSPIFPRPLPVASPDICPDPKPVRGPRPSTFRPRPPSPTRPTGRGRRGPRGGGGTGRGRRAPSPPTGAASAQLTRAGVVSRTRLGPVGARSSLLLSGITLFERGSPHC